LLNVEYSLTLARGLVSLLALAGLRVGFPYWWTPPQWSRIERFAQNLTTVRRPSTAASFNGFPGCVPRGLVAPPPGLLMS